MNKYDFFNIIIFLVMGAAGFCIGTYAGGILTGASLILILFVTVGKMMLKKIASRIDKRTRDILIDNED